jgi:hypothetical protein
VHLIVFVVGAEHVHRDIYGEPDGKFSMPRCRWFGLEKKRSIGFRRQRTQEIARQEKYLSLSTTYDGLDSLGTEKPTLGARNEIKRLVKYVRGLKASHGGFLQNLTQLTTNRATKLPKSGLCVINDENTTETKKRLETTSFCWEQGSKIL